MKNIFLLVGVGVSSFALAEPFEFGYQWSLSGKQYVTTAVPLKELPYQFSLDGVAGYELKTGVQPSLGLGLSYKFEDPNGFYAKLGAFALFPQQQKPDFGFGLSVGMKF